MYQQRALHESLRVHELVYLLCQRWYYTGEFVYTSLEITAQQSEAPFPTF